MSRQFIPTRDISFYANRVLRDLEIEHPPVPVEPVLKYFGIELEELSDNEIKELSKRAKKPVNIPAFLCREGDEARIFVRESDSEVRKRLSIFHEVGHYDIPWHRKVSYLCDCDSSDNNKMKDFEKEAYQYASGLMFPSKCFNEDIHILPTSMQSISHLAEKYEASFEATAIKYVTCHPDKCALLYITPILTLGAKHFFYEVVYSITSKKFYGYWHVGQRVIHHDMLELSKKEGIGYCGEIPASVFGSSKQHNYFAEVRPYGPLNLCVFLKMEDKQTGLFGSI